MFWPRKRSSPFASLATIGTAYSVRYDKSNFSSCSKQLNSYKLTLLFDFIKIYGFQALLCTPAIAGAADILL
jgi:hypothetical protein